MSPDYCPNCGAEVPANASACPSCGSDEETGWSDSAHSDRLGLPDEDFDYERFTREEFGEEQPARGGQKKWLWSILAILIVAVLVWSLIR